MTGTSLEEKILGLCRAIREGGGTPGAPEAVLGTQALLAVDLGDPEEMRLALRLGVCRTLLDQALFDRLYPAFLGLGDPSPAPAPPLPSEEGPGAQEKERGVPSSAQGPSEMEGEPKRSHSRSASAHPGRDGDGRAEVPDTALDRSVRAAREIVRRLEGRTSRRLRPAPRGPRLDVRRTLRQGLSTDLEPLDLRYLGRRRNRPAFVWLLDGSRSMKTDAPGLLQFAYAFTLASDKTEVFIFSTGLRRVTEALRRAPSGGLPALGDLGAGWGGGTRIGDCLTTFLQGDGRRLLGKETLVFIASDGLETGSVAVLEAAVRKIHRDAAALIWLNPLMSTLGYRPEARGMRAALPHIDLFSSGEDPLALVDQISRMAQKGR